MRPSLTPAEYRIAQLKQRCLGREVAAGTCRAAYLQGCKAGRHFSEGCSAGEQPPARALLPGQRSSAKPCTDQNDHPTSLQQMRT